MKDKLKKLFPLNICRIQTTKNGTKMCTIPRSWAQVNLVKEIRWFWDTRNNWLVLVPLDQTENQSTKPTEEVNKLEPKFDNTINE